MILLILVQNFQQAQNATGAQKKTDSDVPYTKFEHSILDLYRPINKTQNIQRNEVSQMM